MPPLKLTVVTPVYNEEDVIEHFHTRTRRELDLIKDVDSHIIFVMDRSSDNTLAILRNIVKRDPKSKVITLSSRFGHQMSLLAGIDNAQDSDVIIMMDSDLQHPPEIIPKLLAEYHKGAEIVYTVRKHSDDVGFIRRLCGNFFYRIIGKLSSTNINLNAADFRLINRKVANLLCVSFKERNVFLRGLFSWIGFKQTCVEYTAGQRFAGTSKYSLARVFQLATAGILSFSTRPLYIGIFIGIGFSMLAFLFMLTTIIGYFIDRSIPSGWTTLVTLLLLFSGVQLIVMGIIGTYIGGIYEEVKARPRYIIDEEINNHE